MSATGTVISRFHDLIEDDPFAYNETASVSVLAAAAAKADMIGMAEFCATKGSRTDRRVSASGRCDLWLSSEERSWAFEFKQVSSSRISDGLLRKAGDAAEADAKHLRMREADRRVAGLVLSTYWVEGEDAREAAATLAREYAADWQFAWELPRAHQNHGHTFLFLEPL